MGNLYTTPSGMGGTFDVVIVEDQGDQVSVRVHMPRNPDWHGYTFTTTRDQLTEVAQS